MFVNYDMHNDNYKLQRDLMDNHIRVFNNVLQKETCENLIEKFESLKDEHENFPENKPFFTQINFSKSDNWTNESHILLNLFTEYLEKYRDSCKIEKKQWPLNYTLEPIRMKLYLPNDSDEFPPHVDVDASKNLSRFLAFFLYLTTNKEGDTLFPNVPYVSPCIQGSLLMFPPAWCWLHQGRKPIGSSKYIVGSYLHYVNS